MAKIQLGVLTKVANTKRKLGSALDYTAQWAMEAGKPVPMMFTDNDIYLAHQRALQNMEDMPALEQQGRHCGICSILKRFRIRL